MISMAADEMVEIFGVQFGMIMLLFIWHGYDHEIYYRVR